MFNRSFSKILALTPVSFHFDGYVEIFRRYHYSWNSVILSAKYLQSAATIDFTFGVFKTHGAYELTENRFYPIPGLLIFRGQLYLPVPVHTSSNHFERNSRYSLQMTSSLLGSLLLDTFLMDNVSLSPNRSSPAEVFLQKVVLKICSKFIAEHPCRSVISIDYVFAKQLYWNHTSTWVLSCKFAAYFQNTFSKEHLRTAASVQSQDVHI